MLEAEWAFTSRVDDVCQVVEGAIKRALFQEDTQADFELLWKSRPQEQLDILENARTTERWSRMSYSDAIKELLIVQEASKPFKFSPKWGQALQSEHERYIADKITGGPTFVTDYPAGLKPFYMRPNEDGKTVACFDLLVPHLGELAGGSLREERLPYLERAIDNHGLDPATYDWYLDIRKYGGAPHGGFGLGFERLISWLTGVENVRECIAMPRWAGRMLL